MEGTQTGRRRRARTIALSDAEWQTVVDAARAAAQPGAGAREASPAAWARRVLLLAADRTNHGRLE